MWNFSEAEIAAALEACAREPVHRPGAIQPCGVLISLDGELERVLQVSANLDAVLDLPVQRALGAGAERLLGSALRERLRRGLSGRERLPSALSVPVPVGGGARAVHVTAYRSGQRVVVELEPAGDSDQGGLLSVVNEALRQVGEADSPQHLLETLVDSVRQLTGDERVMVYQFDADCHGSVVAESRAAGADSYLGHHFPASDIPRQVRQLYAINPVRSIPDATADPVPLMPGHDPLEGTPLDLSQGMLRAVSPVHLSYLGNMGVGASLSLAMHGEDGLWGLVACHGMRPRALAPAVRDASWALVQAATARLMLLLARADARYLRRVRDSRDLLSKDRGGLLSPDALVQRHGPDWLALFRACGVALVYRETASGVGRLPSDDDLQRLASSLSESQPREGIWCSRNLRDSALAGALGQSECCGLLAVPLPIDKGKPGWLLLFRPEQIETRLWAGKPEGLTAMRDGHLQLLPRNSFAAWREEIRGCSEPWSAIEQQAAADLGEDLAVLVFSREIDLLNARLTEANKRLERLAHTDTLTSVWNRYHTEKQIDAAISAAERAGKPCTLLLFDIDHFKQVNDRLGHEAGDRVLTTLAREIDQHLRGGDYLGRWGGEEFVVVASGSNLLAGGTLAERLRRHVAETSFCGVGRITISVGVATWREGDSRRTLLERADRAMYRAKHDGRNRVVELDS